MLRITNKGIAMDNLKTIRVYVTGDTGDSVYMCTGHCFSVCSDTKKQY